MKYLTFPVLFCPKRVVKKETGKKVRINSVINWRMHCEGLQKNGKGSF